MSTLVLDTPGGEFEVRPYGEIKDLGDRWMCSIGYEHIDGPGRFPVVYHTWKKRGSK
jgi:hypothetical protein